MSTALGIPEPCEYVSETQDEYMARALEAEKDGARLVVEMWVDPDRNFLNGDWQVTWLYYLDYHTKEYLFGYDPNGPEAEVKDDRFVIVKRGVAA